MIFELKRNLGLRTITFCWNKRESQPSKSFSKSQECASKVWTEVKGTGYWLCYSSVKRGISNELTYQPNDFIPLNICQFDHFRLYIGDSIIWYIMQKINCLAWNWTATHLSRGRKMGLCHSLISTNWVEVWKPLSYEI